MNDALSAKIEEWSKPPFDEETRAQLNLLKQNPEQLDDAFYKDLEFGTGGMRGIMGIGTNRINAYTLGKSTQGLCDYLKSAFSKIPIKVVIAYDCRNNSKSLAVKVAEIFSANNVKVFIFSDLRTTPELSFAVKYLEAHCGIVLTASHNPPEYNGYKVYWKDGGQIVPPQDNEIIEQINNTRFSDIQFNAKKELIEWIDQKIDQAFFDKSVQLGQFEQNGRENFKIVFTPLHGTSITAVPQVLAKAGYTDVHLVEAQSSPNGNFPTVESPNPEEPEALMMALDLANGIGADMVIGTDPDSDRLGIAVRDNNNKFRLLNGNQTMVVMTYFLLEQRKKSKRLDGRQFVASTIVSTPMIQKIAEAYGIQYRETLTGFKWIGKLIEDFPSLEFIGGGEESFGYLVGDAIRDKDAVTASLLACEVGTYAKNNNQSFYEILIECYRKFGAYKEKLISFTQKGKEGANKIKAMMEGYRNNPPKEISGIKVSQSEDYLKSEQIFILENRSEKINLPKADVLIFSLEDHSKIAVRPSGTEPKIKFYFSVNDKLQEDEDWDTVEFQLDQKISTLIKGIGL
ncbi:MAG: phospho-sugar mutase [Bacteroidota bacterium]|nr:phospho-sugar mutase [Bacteroidota bacterium]